VTETALLALRYAKWRALGIDGREEMMLDARPQETVPSRRHAVMLFADIMNSSQLSDSLTVEEYYSVVQEFRTCSEGVVSDVLRRYQIRSRDVEWSSVGDELKVFCVPEEAPPDRMLSQKLAHAALCLIDLAFRLKIAWLASSTNSSRLKEHKAPVDLGVGIHAGPVMVRYRGEVPVCDGYSINLAKRIEGKSREGHGCRIVMSHAVNLLLEVVGRPRGPSAGTICGEMHGSEMKGISEPPRIFEVVQFDLVEPCVLRQALADLDESRRRGLLDLASRAIETSRQTTWYGLLCIAILQELGDIQRAVGLAEQMLAQDENFSLCRFLGAVYADGNAYRAVMFNRRALRLEPNDYMAQFNLAVALSHSRDLPDELGSWSTALMRSTLEEYRKAEQIARAHGFLGRGGDADWKHPLFQAHVYASMARQSMRERGAGCWPQCKAFTQTETLMLDHALALYERARAVLADRPDLRERWYAEYLRYSGEALEMAGNFEKARAAYHELIEVGEASTSKGVQNMVTYARGRLAAMR